MWDMSDIIDLAKWVEGELISLGAEGASLVIPEGSWCKRAQESEAAAPMIRSIAGWAMLHRCAIWVPQVAPDQVVHSPGDWIGSSCGAIYVGQPVVLSALELVWRDFHPLNTEEGLAVTKLSESVWRRLQRLKS